MMYCSTQHSLTVLLGLLVLLLLPSQPAVIAQEDPSLADMIVPGEGDPSLGTKGKKTIPTPFAQPLPLPLWHNPVTNIDQQVLLYFGLYSGLTNQRITFLNAAFFSRMAGTTFDLVMYIVQ